MRVRATRSALAPASCRYGSARPRVGRASKERITVPTWLWIVLIVVLIAILAYRYRGRISRR